MITATLDVNCINLKEDPPLDKIHSLGKEGKIKLYKSDTADTEIIYGNLNSKNTDRLVKSENLEEDCGAFVLGHSRLGHGRLGSDKKIERLEKSSNLEEDKGTGVWNNSRWNHCKWGDEKSTYIEEIKEIIFKDFDSLPENKQMNQFKLVKEIYSKNDEISSKKLELLSICLDTTKEELEESYYQEDLELMLNTSIELNAFSENLKNFVAPMANLGAIK